MSRGHPYTSKHKVLDVLASHAGESMVMRQIVRECVGPVSTTTERLAWQRTIHRMCKALSLMGVVEITKPRVMGAQQFYKWVK
jgi:hypothetical protein